jgi:hypothetical protein
MEQFNPHFKSNGRQSSKFHKLSGSEMTPFIPVTASNNPTLSLSAIGYIC